MKIEELATKSDLNSLLETLTEIHQLLMKSQNSTNSQFLRSNDVKKLLRISDGTLQRMRISGCIKAKKINGTWFYSMSEINTLLNTHINK